MHAKEVLQNIHYFLGTVLPNAHFGRNWDVPLLNEAFLWAEYCEMVYESAVDQPFASKLDSDIRIVGSALANYDPSPVCLEYLKSSSKVLCEALMQNSFLENSVYQAVLRKAEDKRCLKELIQNATEMKSVFIALLDVLSVQSSCDNAELTSQKTETEFHMNDIEKSIIECSSKEEVEQLVSSYLNVYFSDSTKMKEFLLLAIKPTCNQESTQRLEDIFINELLKRINREDSLYQPLVASHVWNQSPSLLCSLASKSFLFFKCYVDFLVQAAQGMRANYGDSDVIWETVSTDIGIGVTFPSVLLHLKCLLNVNEKVCAATKTLLLSLAKNPDESPIWHDICNHLMVV